MAKSHQDTKGYYRSLGVPTTATDTEIRLAFVLLKGKGADNANPDTGSGVVENDEAQRAYNFLKNPARRQAYDRAETTGFSTSINVKFKLNDPRLLVATILLLAGVLGFVWVPLYG